MLCIQVYQVNFLVVTGYSGEYKTDHNLLMSVYIVLVRGKISS